MLGTLTAVLAIVTLAQSPARSEHQQSVGQPLAPPTAPLDERIDAKKITRSEPPLLPRAIAQPLPVVHRVATRAEDVPLTSDAFTKARRAIDAGLAYLRKTQRASGAWMEKEKVQPTDQPRVASASLAVTAMGAKAFEQAGTDDAVTRKALKFVVDAIRERGYDGASQAGIGNYVASAVVSALAASGNREFETELQGGVAWLKRNQWDQSEGLAPDQDWFGGAGYGNSKRPDLSNTQFMLDALHDAGVSPDDPAVQKALAFVARAQNLPSLNASAWSKSGSADGGFVYTPANGGESFASDKAGEGRYGEKMPEGQPRSLRSYGSMTYAGFKSLLYAGLSRDDPRVKAAFAWIAQHYTFDENPGLGPEGLYYYYHAMARALFASQQQVIPVAAPKPGADAVTTNRAWREDLIAALTARQREDGAWINSADRWEESQADLATIYAILALEEAIKPTMRTE
ncbi:MAG: prenyltransferase/squalene oxidase repeat-containing protein [Phycisphaerae bacterium]|nr:prenyltransferase/squalene oxidase repeat-containing protein [Phycisphaerae bacterium]